MAPTAGTAATAKRQTRRTVPIIPAIPHKLSRPQRAARPITPEETLCDPKAVTQPEVEADPQQSPNAHDDTAKQQSVQDPLTPDTQTSSGDPNQHEEDAPDTTANDSARGDADNALHTRDISSTPTVDSAVDLQKNSLEDTPSDTGVNGERVAATVPDELPPPFYPSEQFGARSQLSEQPTAPSYAQPAFVSSHNSQPSTDGLVFGALQDSPAVPSTPHDLEQDFRAPLQPVLRQPPGLMRPEYASPFYPGHVHHLSRSQAAWAPPTMAAAPVEPPFINGGTFPHAHHVGHGTYNGSYQGLQVNGTGTSRSQSPMKPQFAGTQPSSEHGEDRRTNGANVQQFPPPPPKFDILFELLDYLNSQLGNPEFADAILRVRSHSSVLLELPVHTVIVARSQPIAYAIQRSRSTSTRTDTRASPVELFVQDKFVSRDAANEAIKVLYGAPLLTIQDYLYGLSPFFLGDEQSANSHDARKRMADAISYAAAGRLFGLHTMHKRGLELVRALLRWDTVEQALEYGLEESVYAQSRDEAARGTASPVEFDAANALAHDCLHFLAYEFPGGFNLYLLAPELQGHPRLPSFVEARQPTHNPRLSGIRFGDVPVEDGLNPDYITRVVSSILLSLPMALLDGLLNQPRVVTQLGWPGVEHLMHNVISEREQRRKRALTTSFRHGHDKNNPLPQRVIDNLFHEELVNGRNLSERYQGQHVDGI